MRIQKIKCDGGCGAKKPVVTGSKSDSFTCYKCKRKVARKPKQNAYAAAHAPVAKPTETNA